MVQYNCTTENRSFKLIRVKHILLILAHRGRGLAMKGKMGIIRCFVSKGKAIRDIPLSEVRDIEKGMNQYPRKILNYEIPEERFYKNIKDM